MEYRIKYKSVCDQVVETGRKLISTNLVAGSWGNISIKAENGIYAITPSGRSYQTLESGDIVLIDDSSRTVDGNLIPSSESKLHTEIYKAFPEAGAIIHTHSIYASALATMRKGVPALIEDMVQIIGGRVECAEYALPGTEELAFNAVKALNGKKAALMANHGAVCWGKTIEEAFVVAEILEKSAQIAIICNQCGGAVELDDDDVQIMHGFYKEHYSKRQAGEE